MRTETGDSSSPTLGVARIAPGSEGSISELQAALAAAPMGPGAVALHAAIVLSYLRTDRLAEAASHAASAVRLAALTDEPVPEIQARLALAQVLQALGMRELVLQELAQAPSLPDDIDPDLRARLQATFASALRGLGRLHEAAAIFDQLLVALPADAHLRQTVRLNAASTFWQVERCEDALRALSEVQTHLRQYPSPYLLGWLHAIRAWVHRARGDEASAVQDARHALALTDSDLPTQSSAVRALLEPPITACAERARVVAEALALLTVAERTGRLTIASEVAHSLALEAKERGDPTAEAALLRRMGASDRRRTIEAEQLLMTSTAARAEMVAARAESDALRAQSAALAEANERLRALMASRERLIRAMAHDLRGPLTAIRLGLDLVRAPSNPALLADLHASAAQLERLLKSALDDASLHPEGLETPRTIDLEDLLNEVLASHRLPAAQRGVTLQVCVPSGALVCVPPESLGRIAHNLLSNAIKFTAPSTAVELAVRTNEHHLTLAVSDRGPGFPAGNPRRLLLDRARGASAGPVEGYGLGLHTTYRLVTGGGGTIELHNRTDGGARVVVTLPTVHEHDPP